MTDKNKIGEKIIATKIQQIKTYSELHNKLKERHQTGKQDLNDVINILETDYKNIESVLEELEKKWVALQFRYQVEFEELIFWGAAAQLKRYQVKTIHIYCETDCQVDTYANNWNFSLPHINDLLTEVLNHIDRYENTNYVLLNIKSIP